MDWAHVFASPHLADVVLAFVLLEALWLILGRRSPAGPVVVLLLPGFFLMLALRAALAGAAWPWVPAALAGSLVAHLADLRLRLRR